MRKPRLLDLFCCEGGAGMGYAQAGFEVVGVDIKPRKRYPFEFVRSDVFALERAFLMGFGAIHASPICQGLTVLRHAPGTKEHPNLIPPTLELLNSTGLLWILENVPGAEPWMPGHIVLCGCMFGLGAQGCRLQRRRLFMANFPIRAPRDCSCSTDPRPVIGIYGGHARKRSAAHGGRGTRDDWEGGHSAAASEAMGMDWATLNGMSEAIPPAYTRWLGSLLIEALSQARAA